MSEPFLPALSDYLRDESRRTGRADRIAFPRNADDVLAALAEARANHWPVTVQGARTGVTGGAVPEGGLVLNLSKMDRILAAGPGELRVEPGATLAAVRAAVPSGFFFAPDPTEPTASIGGMISCNSSGALSFSHGPTRNHILGLRVATLSGDLLDLRRGRDQADGLRFALGPLAGELPPIPRPAVKNAAGYFVDPDMDLVDLFIGAEGTLGVVVEATLRLMPAPGVVWGLMAFLPDTASVVGYVDALRAGPGTGDRGQGTGDGGPRSEIRGPRSEIRGPRSEVRGPRSEVGGPRSGAQDQVANGLQPTAFSLPPSPPRLAALEYFDARCLAFLRAHGDSLASKGIAVPAMPDRYACVYAEWHAPDAATAEAAVMAAAERLPEFGADPDVAILADNPHDMEKLKLFRHAAPELVNSVLDERRKTYPELTKLGTDMSVPDARLADVLALYAGDLAGTDLEHLTFGHIGANHLHVNIISRDPADYAAGKALYAKWAAQVIAWGGSISAEHGIGKLKRELFRQMAGEAGLRQMRALKRMFDPGDLLNRGTLLDAE